MMNESVEFLQNISIDSDSNSITKRAQKCEKIIETRLKKPPRCGYRPVLVNDTQLAKESIELEPLMKFISDEESLLSDQDKVCFFTLAYLNHRYPNNFLEACNPIIDNKNCSESKISSKLLCDLPLKFKNQKIYSRLHSLNLRTLFDVVNSFNLHSVPYSARFTLVNWYLGKS